MYLQLNTQFNPFTFEEMVKPLLLYKQAYDTTEAQYAELQAQTEQWKQAAENDSSPLVRSMYNDYAQRLNNTLADFSRGMTASNRAASMGLKRDFAQNIKPIEVAFKRREALEDEQRKARLANDSLVFERNASDMSLEDFIKNPSASYGDVINGNVLRAASAQAYKNLARRIREGDSELKKILPFTYEQTKKYGLTEDQILEVLKGGEEANEAAKMIRDTIRSTTNIDQWNNEAASKKVDAFINEGIWNALGTEQSAIIKDDYGKESALSAQSYRQNVALENLKHQHNLDILSRQGGGPDNVGSQSAQLQINDSVATISQSTKEDIAKNKKQIQELQAYKNTILTDKATIETLEKKIGYKLGTLSSNTLQYEVNNYARQKLSKADREIFDKCVSRYTDCYRKTRTLLNYHVDGDGTRWGTKIPGNEVVNYIDNAINVLSNKVRTNYKTSYSYPVNVANPELITRKLKTNIGDMTGEALVTENGKKISSDKFGDYLNDSTTYTFDTKGIKVISVTVKDGKTITNSAYLDPTFLGEYAPQFNANLAKMNASLNKVYHDLDGNRSFMYKGQRMTIDQARKSGIPTPDDEANLYLRENLGLFVNSAQATNTLSPNKLGSGKGVETHTEEDPM